MSAVANRRAELARAISAHCVKNGQVEMKLSSGGMSSYYVNIMDGLGELAVRNGITASLLDRLAPYRESLQKINAVGGPEVRAIPVAMLAMMSMEIWLHPKTLTPFFVRKEAKDHGLGRLVEGAVGAGSQCVVIEDVITTGRSTLHTMQELYLLDCNILAVVPVVDRSNSAAAECKVRECAKEAAQRAQERGIKDISADVLYLPLLYAADLGLREASAEETVKDASNTQSVDRMEDSGDGDDHARRDTTPKVPAS